jgi:hypothetical protein
VIRVAFAATHKTTIKDLTDFFTGSICNGHAHVCHAHDPAKGLYPMVFGFQVQKAFGTNGF